MKGIYLVGTDTEIGKTVISAALVYVLCKAGYKTAYFKAALSDAEELNGKLIPGDTEFVCSLSGIQEDYEKLTPYIYRTAVSPYLASKIENKPIDIQVIKDKLTKLENEYNYVLCEGSGGVICPITEVDNKIYTLCNLIKDMKMDVILVCRAGLGTINHTVLTVSYLKNNGIKVKGIIVNQYEENRLCKDNINMIKKMTGIPILGVMPYINENKKNFIEELKYNACNIFKADEIASLMKEV
ncbi:dethiobiotin synthetase [Clostridium acetobutylicum]|nr:dethiobiotin synthetase [Clostridium acetobutylicum]